MVCGTNILNRLGLPDQTASYTNPTVHGLYGILQVSSYANVVLLIKPHRKIYTIGQNQYGVLGGIAFMAVGFTFATRWE
jgi:hypothetical protein